MDISTGNSFRRASAVAIAVSTVTILPLSLVGALGVQVSVDLGVSPSELGSVAAAFFGTGAIISPFAGAVAARLGPRAAMRLAVLLGAVILVSIGVGAHSLPMLLCMIALAGAGHAVSQVSTNIYLAENTSLSKQGTAYGIKQSAIPAAGMIAGIAVPVIALTIGWRWAFAGFAIPAMLFAVYSAPIRDSTHRRASSAEKGQAPGMAIRMIAIGSCLAAASASCLNIFLVSGAVAAGWSETHAGLIFAGSSMVGIIVRLFSGIRADRRGKHHLEAVATMLGLGALGFLALSSGELLLYLVGAAVGFGWGWGWPGLLIFAAAQESAGTPAAGMALVQLGNSVGCVVGPLVFGVLIEQFSYTVAWSTAGAVLLIAAAILVAARSWATAASDKRADKPEV